jgi:hypothetical protein
MGVGSVAGNIKYHSLGGPVEKYTPLARRPEFGPEGKHFVTGNSLFFIRGESSETAMGGGGARSAPLGVAMSPKRRVRAAHGRARAANTHLFRIIAYRKVYISHKFSIS